MSDDQNSLALKSYADKDRKIVFCQDELSAVLAEGDDALRMFVEMLLMKDSIIEMYEYMNLNDGKKTYPKAHPKHFTMKKKGIFGKWSKARIKNALDGMTNSLIKQKISEFYMLHMRSEMTPQMIARSVSRELQKAGWPPRDARFYLARVKEYEQEYGRLLASIDECIGPDGEIYGHRD